MLRLLLYVLLATIALAGCSPIYYPNAPRTVLPVDRGDAVAGLHAGSNGIEAQAAVAPIDNAVIGASGSYLYVPGKDRYIRHSYGEVFVGWSDTSGRAFMSALGGAGAGWTETPPGSHLPWDNATFDSARYARVFLQASIGSLKRPRSLVPGERSNSGFALGVRAAWVRASELWIDDNVQHGVSDVFVEPFLTLQSFGETMGTVVDIGISLNPRGGLRFHHSPLRLGVSLVYSIGDAF